MKDLLGGRGKESGKKHKKGKRGVSEHQTWGTGVIERSGTCDVRAAGKPAQTKRMGQSAVI